MALLAVNSQRVKKVDRAALIDDIEIFMDMSLLICRKYKSQKETWNLWIELRLWLAELSILRRKQT